ncbi:MAG: hypothetical protein SOX56_00820 [[Pasteurella] mairii]|uniref:Uncharacterized protein n=1 Tax=[Pasteurella] mairii TaxID=757 RepID=A0A379B465_9PAST|nr:hypothetical protein [[Pasteurella] mairii]SUB33038.1 Uncharacterised protein [[Pasteurella] mairii]
MRFFNLNDLCFSYIDELNEERNIEGLFLVSSDEQVNLISESVTGGGAVWEENGMLKCSGKAPSPAHQFVAGEWVITPEKLTALLEQHKNQLIKKLAEKIDSFKAQLLVGYPQAEIDSFFRQEAEALAYQADHKAPTPMLSQIAENRGVALEELAVKVLEKSAQFAVAMGALIGVRQGFEDRILAAQNQEQLEQIENEVNAWQRSI